MIYNKAIFKINEQGLDQNFSFNPNFFLGNQDYVQNLVPITNGILAIGNTSIASSDSNTSFILNTDGSFNNAGQVLTYGQLPNSASASGSYAYLVGQFTSVSVFDLATNTPTSTYTMNHICRINTTTGLLDTTYTPPVLTGGFINPALTQVDSAGRIYISGSFTCGSYTNLLRLHADGTLDTTFPTTLEVSFTQNITSMISAKDGGVIVFSGLNSYFDATHTNSVMRFTAAGAVDTNFSALPLPASWQTAGANVLPFNLFETTSSYKYLYYANNTIPFDFIRLNSDWTIDTTYSSPHSAQTINIQKLYEASGNVFVISGGPNNNFPLIQRANESMVLDNTFTEQDTSTYLTNGGLNNSFNNTSFSMANASLAGCEQLADGNIYLWGVNYLIRLSPEGIIDQSYPIYLFPSSSYDTYYTHYNNGTSILVGCMLGLVGNNGIWSYFGPFSDTDLSSDNTYQWAFSDDIKFAYKFSNGYTLFVFPDQVLLLNGDYAIQDNWFADQANLPNIQSVIELTNGSVLIGAQGSSDSAVYLFPDATLLASPTVVDSTTFQSTSKMIFGSDNNVYVGGVTSSGSTTIIRLTPTGAKDSSYVSPSAANIIVDMVLLPSTGYIYILCHDTILRLQPNGTFDSSYNAGQSSPQNIAKLAVSSDNSHIYFYNSNINSICRLIGSTGLLDTSYTSPTSFGGSSDVNVLYTSLSGHIYMGGRFSLTNPDYVNLIRLKPDGTFDNTLSGTGAMYNAAEVTFIGEF